MLIKMRLWSVPEGREVLRGLVEKGLFNSRSIRCDDLGLNRTLVENGRYPGISPETASGGVGAWQVREIVDCGQKVVIDALEEVSQGDLHKDCMPRAPFWKVPRHVIRPLIELLLKANEEFLQVTLRSSWVNTKCFEEFHTEGSDRSWLLPPAQLEDLFECAGVYPVDRGERVR
jgi:hypothetical protein